MIKGDHQNKSVISWGALYHASHAPQIVSRKLPIHMYADERNKVQIVDLHIIDGYISLFLFHIRTA